MGKEGHGQTNYDRKIQPKQGSDGKLSSESDIYG